MSRPVKCRRVDFFPETRYFKPAGIPLKILDEVCLSIEEIEAIRLKDLEGLEQQTGAERMNVSRPTYQRILASARQKIADAVLNGKAIRIEGGNYEITPRHFKCINSHEWEIPFDEVAGETPKVCPICNSAEITTVQSSKGVCRRMNSRRCCQRTRHLQEENQVSQ